MSYVAKDKEVDAPAPVKLHKIRITLTSRNVKSLEKMSNDLVNRSKDKKLHVKGPVRLPTKVLSTPPASRLVVRVRRPGITTRCASTSAWSTCTRPVSYTHLRAHET